MTKGQLPFREALQCVRRVRPRVAVPAELTTSLREFEEEVKRRQAKLLDDKLHNAIMGTLGFNPRHRDYA